MWVVLGVLALPLVEIALFVTLGAALGLWLTLAWVLLTGIGGVLMLKGLALSGRHRLREGLQDGLLDPLSPLAQPTRADVLRPDVDSQDVTPPEPGHRGG